MYSLAVFKGVDLYALKFHLVRVVPINHSWHQKTRDTGLPDGGDRILLRSLHISKIFGIGESLGYRMALLV